MHAGANLLNELLSRYDEQRQRIAAELHEDTIQDLAAAAFRLDLVSGDLLANTRLADEISSVRRNLLIAVQKLRDLASDVSPAVLEHLGVACAVRWYARERLGPRGLRVSVADTYDGRLPGAVERTLYAVAQEAINNIDLHAQASTVDIRFECRDGALELSIQDDGRGFAHEPHRHAAGNEGRMGIALMHIRMGSLGGELVVRSTPHGGTRVTARIPPP